MDRQNWAVKKNENKEESCNEKFDSNNKWKTAWPRIILEWQPFLRLSLGFIWKILSFVEKHLSFYPKEKMSVHFLYFYLNEKELNQQVCLIKYVENEISNSTFHKKRERERERERERGAKT